MNFHGKYSDLVVIALRLLHTAEASDDGGIYVEFEIHQELRTALTALGEEVI